MVLDVTSLANVFELHLWYLGGREAAELPFVLAIFKLSDMFLQTGNLLTETQDVGIVFGLIILEGCQAHLAFGHLRAQLSEGLKFGRGLSGGCDQAGFFLVLLEFNLCVGQIVALLGQALLVEESALGAFSERQVSRCILECLEITIGEVAGSLGALVRYLNLDDGGFAVCLELLWL